MSFADLVALTDRFSQEHLGGVPVIYQPKDGEPVTEPIIGMFDRGYVLIEQGEAGVEQIGPSVFLRLEDLPADPAVDDPTLTIEGRTYRVRERQPDGLGGIRLLLYVTG